MVALAIRKATKEGSKNNHLYCYYDRTHFKPIFSQFQLLKFNMYKLGIAKIMYKI